MKKRFLSVMTLAGAVALAVSVFSSCISDAVKYEPEVRQMPSVSFDLYEQDPEEIETRSILGSSFNDGKKTNVTLAAYTGGVLSIAKDFSSGPTSMGLTSMGLTLEMGHTYNVYAVVNMGAMASSFPQSESALSSMTYNIPAYTGDAPSVSAWGIPMAGVLQNLSVTPSTTGTKTVPVTRLLAKVTTILSCDWDGATIQSAKIYNMNKALKPFGSSAATGSTDMLSFQEVETGGSGSTLTGTFYVPENMQGTVSGISSSYNKSKDKNTTVNNNSAKLTYLEVATRTTNGPVAGSATYRSYLGANATNDFNIERNHNYVWTVNYHVENTQDYDWKRESDMFRIIVTADKTQAYVGETVQLTATLYPTEGNSSDVRRNCNWVKNSGSSGSISVNNGSYWDTNSKGQVTATAAGTATIRASYTSGDYSAWADSPTITFLNTTTVRRYVMQLANGTTPANASINVGATQGYKVVYYEDIYRGSELYQQGTTAINVSTSSGYWYTGSNSIATVSNGTVTGVGAGTTAVNWKVNQSDASVACSGSVTVNDIITNWLEITPVSTTATAGETVSLVAKYHTVTNGVDNGGVIVTTDSGTSWSRTSGSTSISVNNTSTNKGKVTCSSTIQTAQTATIRATYSGQTTTATVTFNPTISYALVANPTSASVNVGGTTTVKADVYRVVGGTRESSPVAPNVSATWSSSATGKATINNSGVVTGVSAGTAYMSASYTYQGDDLTTTGNDRCLVTVSDVVTYELRVEPSPASCYVNGTVQVYAMLYTITNGVAGSYDNVTSSATFNIASGSSSYIQHNGSGVIRGLAVGTGYVNASVTVSGKGSFSTNNSTRGRVNVVADQVSYYDNPVVTLSYSPNPIAYTGGTSNPTVSVTQTIHMASGTTTSESYNSLSAIRNAGYTVSFSGSAAGFTLSSGNNGTGVVTASSNTGSSSTSYSDITVSLTYNPTSLAAAGGTSNPTVSYSQTVTTTRAATSARSITVTATVTMHGKSGSASATVNQAGDSGASSNETITSGATVTYSFVSNVTGFSINSTTGVVTATANTGASRSTNVRCKVTVNEKTSGWSNQVTITQSAATSGNIDDDWENGGEIILN